jgi:hypothetical protein
MVQATSDPCLALPGARRPDGERPHGGLPRGGMKQYQAVITKLQGKAHEDEETLTDLLNERALAGWFYESSTALAANRLLIVFVRQA